MENEIVKECDDIKLLLLNKNKKYGNAALDPKRIFSKQNALEQIKVRIDDKISRIQNLGVNKESSDTVMDLIGYLILLRIALKQSGEISDNDLEKALSDS